MKSYSVFNNYNYTDKPTKLVCLDYVSSPIRVIFSGKNISVISGDVENFSSQLLKVVFFGCLILLAPKVGCFVATISLTALIIKQVTTSAEEIKKIQNALNPLKIEPAAISYEKRLSDEIIELSKQHEFRKKKHSHQHLVSDAIAIWIQTTLSKDYRQFSKLEELMTGLYQDDQNKIVDAYIQILTHLDQEKGHINYLEIETLNRILFVDLMLSKVEQLQADTNKVNPCEIRKQIFGKIEHFPHHKEDYKRAILEIQELLESLHALETLEQSLIQQIKHTNLKKFKEDLGKLCHLAQKMSFDPQELSQELAHLTQALTVKIYENRQNFIHSKDLDWIRKYDEHASDAREVAEDTLLVGQKFSLSGQYFFESYRVYNVILAVTKQLFELN